MRAAYSCATAFAMMAGALAAPLAAHAWEPTKTVEFVVPAGTGGGADPMARAIQGIIAKHGLMKQTMVVINKAGGGRGQSVLPAKGAQRGRHKNNNTPPKPFTPPPSPP